MKQFLILIILLCPAISAHAVELQSPDESLLQLYMPESATLETRLDADVTGDGVIDVVFIATNEDVRVLKVMAGYADEVNMGHEPLSELALEPYPMGPAQLHMEKNVLIVEDLTGGTTALSSLFRYRYDPAEHRMQLIGDDVTLYSRTNQHDAITVSTNRLTGDRITQISKLTDAGDYMDEEPVKEKISAEPVYMEDTPNPAETVGWGE